LYDTGGLTNESLPFQQAIEQQVRYAINECDIIVFVVSNIEGIDAKDIYISKLLKKFKTKKIILVANKADNNNHQFEKNMYSLG
jgi:predicted GTPase